MEIAVQEIEEMKIECGQCDWEYSTENMSLEEELSQSLKFLGIMHGHKIKTRHDRFKVIL